ncbi:Lsr2 family DNA-binding protein [Streptomyces sasae]|uniref:Lsr2 family DNA-binding protein n=1 Tax=Streptomyces sasae TaxID=1266772 RepID=UPI00292D9C33|nr:hypothetical protein [Streptomyces sasae]
MSARDIALLMLKSRRGPGEIHRATGMSTGQIAALAEVHGLSQTAARSGGPLAGIDPTLVRGLAALMWTEQNAGHQRARNQAARVRQLLAELVSYQSHAVAESRIRSELAEIDRKLVPLLAKLSRLGTSSTVVIREWAVEQGMTANLAGMLPNRIIDAFEQQPHYTDQLAQRRAVTAARLQGEIVALKRKRAATRRRLDSLTNPPAADVRAWAINQGLDVPDRGSLPGFLVEAYKDQQAKALTQQDA